MERKNSGRVLIAGIVVAAVAFILGRATTARADEKPTQRYVADMNATRLIAVTDPATGVTCYSTGGTLSCVH